MTYIKKNSPNKITTTTCVPLIDEKKMEAEKKKIAEEASHRILKLDADSYFI
jgi:hypothetical protein